MKSFSFGEQTVFYQIYGSGEPLILLHGFMEDSSMWDSILSELQDYKVITVDLPCHGLSRFNEEKCSMALMANAVHELLAELRIENPTIIGHSMGGYVGLELSKLRDIQLVLLHSNFWEDPESKKNDRNRVIEIVKQNKELFIREAIPGLFAPRNLESCKDNIKDLIQKAKQIPAGEIAAVTAGMRDRSANYQMVDQGNVSIIHGDLDPIILTTTLLDELGNLDSLPQVIQIENCGHMSIWEAPEALLAAIKKALKSGN
jgi:pimeloyl-ACP methyl ester carboxylesterase